MSATEPSLAVCIPTASRPELLERCLESVFAGTVLPDQVVVSDEGAEVDAARRVCDRFPAVEYHVGPRRGVCANRNALVALCRTSHLSLLDDDATLTPDFIEHGKRWIAQVDDHTLLTGELLEDNSAGGGQESQGTAVSQPITDMTFWGFGGRDPRGDLRSVHANCNILPRRAFSEVRFDERLVYGPDFEDLCAQLLALDSGYEIRHVPDLVTLHTPPSRDSAREETRQRDARRARFYVALKRYFALDRRFGAGLAFVVLAPVREVLARARRGTPRLAATAIPDFLSALGWFFEYRRRPGSAG